MDDVSNLI